MFNSFRSGGTVASGLRRILWALTCTLACAVALVSAPVSAATGYTQTQYPIVLVHGLFGFDDLFGLDYFYGVPAALSNGGAKVFVVKVSAANSNEVRGEQLLTQVKNILALTGAQKVNLIGHSQGAPTARYVAGVAPQLVASVTSVGGVNRGSPVADAVLSVAPSGSAPNSVLSSIANALSGLINLASGGVSQPQSSAAALTSLSTNGSALFNQRFPQGIPTTACGNGAELVNGVRYFSWTGTQPVTNLLDLSDAFLGLTSVAFGSDKNDGLVSACASHLGTSLGEYGHNHLDEVNQILGLRNWFAADPVALYRAQANRLQNLGL